MVPTDGAQIAYERDGVNYLDRVAALFGAYKRRSVEFLKPFDGMHLLDAGCGAGDDARALAELAGPTGKVTGLDVSSEMIAVAKQRTRNSVLPLNFIQGDICHINEDDAAFDRVRADRVFQHLHEPEQAMHELCRVTRPGGWIVVMDVDWSTLLVDAKPVELTQRILGYHFTRHANGAAGRSLYGLFKGVGLSDVEVVSETFLVTDAGLAFFLWGLDVTARDVVDRDVATRSEIDSWMAHIKARDQAGAFLSAITGFAVRAKKPT